MDEKHFNLAFVSSIHEKTSAAFGGFGHWLSNRPTCLLEIGVVSINVLREVGLGYLRLGQPATELSGGEAQRIKLATELQRMQRGDTLYVLDEPTTGLHPSDVERLMKQLEGLVESGNTVVVIEHDMHVIAQSDWVIDIGPGAGDEGGTVVAAGRPDEVASAAASKTARYLAAALSGD